MVEDEAQPAATAELINLPPLDEVLRNLGLENQAPAKLAPASSSEKINPFNRLDLVQEITVDESEPSAGLLPELDDPLAMEYPEIMSIQEIVDEPGTKRSPLKLTEYQKEFPEIFAILGRGSSSPASTPFAQNRDNADRRRVTEAVERAEQWRAERQTKATNERRPKGLLHTLKGWMGKAS